MAWIAAIAAVNQKGKRRRQKGKERRLAVTITIFISVIGAIIPLSVIFLSKYGNDFPIFIMGIGFLVIFGVLILTISAMEFDDDEDPEFGEKQLREPIKVRNDRVTNERFYWGSPKIAESLKSNIQYCSQCGSQVAFEDQFCSTCGRRIL